MAVELTVEQKVTTIATLTPPSGSGLPNLIVNLGITDLQVDQVITHANTDLLVRKYTSDGTRFRNKDSYNEWLRKGRVAYTLVNPDSPPRPLEVGKDLLGIIWFGQEQFPLDPNQYGITFAIRIYGEARGKGLSFPFMQACFDYFTHSEPYQKMPVKGFWLETSTDNEPAVHLYRRYGFVEATPPDGNDKIFMVLSALPRS